MKEGCNIDSRINRTGLTHFPYRCFEWNFLDVNSLTNFKVLFLADLAANGQIGMYFVGMVRWIRITGSNMKN
jgi:hypothetical protein